MTLSVPTAPAQDLRDHILNVFKTELGAVLDVDPEFIDDDASLPELGMDSLKLISLAVRLRPIIGFALPPGLVPVEESIGSLAGLFAQALGAPDPIAALSQAQKARLASAIEADLYLLDAPPPTGRVSAEEAADPKRVFLTGASGFLGAYLVRTLVDRTHAHIHCLVRASDAQAGLARLEDNLRKFDLWSDDIAPRVTIEIGALGPDFLGLSLERFEWLAETCDILYHNGAAVHLTQPYAQMREANVAGTRTMLDLAQRGRIKPIAFVSTVGLLDTPELERFDSITEKMAAADVTGLPNGYTQSKWACEKLVALAAARGVPAASLRVGHVIGDGVSEDLAGRIAQACFRLGAVPELTRPVDYVSPDYVAATIVALPRHLANFGGVYQLANPHPLTPEDVTTLLSESPRPLSLMPAKKWLGDVRAAALFDPTHPMAAAADLLGDPDHPEEPSFVEHVMARPRLDSQHVTETLADDRPDCASARDILRSVLERMPEIAALAATDDANRAR